MTTTAITSKLRAPEHDAGSFEHASDAVWGNARRLRASRTLAMLAATATLLAAAPAAAHEHSGYSHENTLGSYQPDWMSSLPDGAHLSQLSIPGTHDTMAHYGGDAVQTQTLSLDEQLYSGVRALDIRCHHVANSCEIYHGIVPQSANLDDVLTIITDFLDDNPTEAVIMRVREPENNLDPLFPNTRTFWQTFEAYRQSHASSFWEPTSDNPTLGDMRGKIVVLEDFSSPIAFGIPWGTASIQDDYNLTTNADLYGKWESIKGHLATTTAGSPGNIYINFLSGSGGSFPYFVASGHSDPSTGAPRLLTGLTTGVWGNVWPDFPRVGCAFNPFIWGTDCSIAYEGTNVLMTERLQSSGQRTGIVYSDFPGAGLIDAVIAQNVFEEEQHPLYWSSAGTIAGKHCVQIHEDADPDTWNDNYLCSDTNLGIQWSQAGPIDGMRCIRVHEDADPHAWDDNYLCVPWNSSLWLSWSQAGPVPGSTTCLQFQEPADPHTWADNYLCQ